MANFFENLGSKISETLANSPAKDLEKNAKAILGSAFNKMDLLTKEEFEIQQQILVRTATKLAELEKRVVELESKLQEKTKKIETFADIANAKKDEVEPTTTPVTAGVVVNPKP